jgi:hypothetical protein
MRRQENEKARTALEGGRKGDVRGHVENAAKSGTPKEGVEQEAGVDASGWQNRGDICPFWEKGHLQLQLPILGGGLETTCGPR